MRLINKNNDHRLKIKPHAPYPFTPSRARCAKSCGAVHTLPLRHLENVHLDPQLFAR